jgi:rRNA maturation RNase YbeY
LKQIAEQVLAAQGIDPDCELSLVITDQETIQNLKRDNLGEYVPADVLAFPFVPRTKTSDSANDPWSLGKVVVSYPQAVAQSDGCCHSVEKELAHLITKGTLSLLGGAPKTKRAKSAREQSILGYLNVK